MKILIVAIVIASGYYYLMTATTDVAVHQTMQLHEQYQSAINEADQIATGTMPAVTTTR